MTTNLRPTAGISQRIGRLTAAGLLSVTLCTSVVLSSTAVAAGAAATTAVRPAQSVGGFVQSINDLRSGLGLGGLATSSELNAVAQRWTDEMAAAGSISHNPALAGQVSGGWKMLGENVGVGYDVIGLMAAFIASPGHYENLVNPAFNYVGIGTTLLPDGRLFTTHVFMQKASASAPATTAPTPSTTTSRPPTSTTVPAVEAEPTPPAPAVEPPAPQPTPTARVATLFGALRSFDPLSA